jgi:hypothetical protein
MADTPSTQPSTTPVQTAEQLADSFVYAVKNKKPLPSSLSPEARAFIGKKAKELGSPEWEEILSAMNELKDLKAEIKESREWSLAFLFEWAKSDLMKWAPKLLDSIIDPTLNEWKPALTGEQKENIKLAILDRIVSGAIPQAVFGTLKGKLDSISGKFQKIDFKNLSLESIDSLTKELSLSEVWAQVESGLSLMDTVQKHIEDTLVTSLADIRKVHESQPQPAGYTELLGHPKALADYKAWEDIPALLGRSGNALLIRTAYREGIKAKILSLESSIIGAEEKKNKVMDFVAKLPETFSDKIIGSLDWILRIPIIWDLVAAFFGYKSGKWLVEDLKTETRERKSVQALLEYGQRKNDNGALEKWGENGKIKLLENIDLSGVDYTKLKDFYKILRTNKINPNNKDFWKAVFIDGKIEMWEDGKKKTLTFAKWQEGKETAETLIKKLNNETRVIEEAPPPAPAPIKKEEPPKTDQPPKADGSKPAWAATSIAWAMSETGSSEKGNPAKAQAPATEAAKSATPAEPKAAKSAEKPLELPPLATALETSFMKAEKFPFEVKHKDWIETVSTAGNTITIGKRIYTLAGKMGLELPAKSISLSWDNVTLTFPSFPTDKVVSKPKNEFSRQIKDLLDYQVHVKNEIAWKDGTLVITRTA